MKDYECLLKEKNNQIKVLTQKLAYIQKINKESVKDQLHKFNEIIAETEKKLEERDKEIYKLKEKQKDLGINRIEGTMLPQIHKEVLLLSKAITGLLNGDEPNMGVLLGEYNRESKVLESIDLNEKEFNMKDLEEVRMLLQSIRTSICDYYAEKYSNG